MTDYRNPTPTVDVIVDSGPSVVLIKRANPPNGWALPGGFVDEGESVEQAAIRECAEETGLEVKLDKLFYVYSDPRRDPRQHTLSVVFIAHHDGPLRAGDDATMARWYRWDDLPDPLAFDHRDILHDYRRFLRTGRLPNPSEHLQRYE